MVPKRVIRKQQDSSRSAPVPLAASLQSLAEAFNGAASQCVLDGEIEAVHRLRTGSRRLQATLEAVLPINNPLLLELTQAWLRSLKKVRRAAGPVRDLDVHRQLLREISGSPAADQNAKQDAKLESLKPQIATLDAWLQQQRTRLAAGMQKQVEKRRRQLMRRQCMVQIALASTADSGVAMTAPSSAVALAAFVAASDSMPRLNAKNLHDFRKAIKKARYVAETGSVHQGDRRVAKELKQVQDAIGTWHDWQCLAKEAGKRKMNTKELAVTLRYEARQHLAEALEVTNAAHGRLLGEWIAIGG